MNEQSERLRSCKRIDVRLNGMKVDRALAMAIAAVYCAWCCAALPWWLGSSWQPLLMGLSLEHASRAILKLVHVYV